MSGSPGRPPRRSPHRDRRGRGLRGTLVPASVPLSRTRAQEFDDMVLDAVDGLDRLRPHELDGVEFAVEDVPHVASTSAEAVVYDSDVVDDGAIPLARLRPAGVDRDGRPIPPRIIVYRRPLEARAADPLDLDDLVHDVVVEQVANLLGLDPEELDPPD